MGTDYYAHAVIGVEVTGKLYIESLRPACSHIQPTGAKFCNECGKSTTPIKVRDPHPSYDPDYSMLANWEVVHTTDRARSFVGLCVRTKYGSEAVRASGSDSSASGIAEIRHKLEASLDPLGLWDASKFGLWAVLYCSY